MKRTFQQLSMTEWLMIAMAAMCVGMWAGDLHAEGITKTDAERRALIAEHIKLIEQADPKNRRLIITDTGIDGPDYTYIQMLYERGVDCLARIYPTIRRLEVVHCKPRAPFTRT